jgi:hypothetical protein
MTTDTLATPAAVTRYWKTGIVVGPADITGITTAEPEPGTSRCVTLEAAAVTGMDRLRDLFLASMRQLADADDGDPAPSDVQVEVQVWRNSYDQPAFASQARYAGWTFLAATDVTHSESGCLNLTDPRAGSSLTAMPGLPWGRQFVIRPAPGTHAVIPGWLTASIVPLEARQQIIVAVATSAS